MKGQGKRSGHRDLRQLADDANLRFVELGRVLLRLVTWSDRAPRRCRCNRSPCRPQARCEPPDTGSELHGPVDDESLRARVMELFHHDALHRLAAARWIRQHRRPSVIPVLEGVLPVEENEEVREEIERAIQVLSALQPSTEEI